MRSRRDEEAIAVSVAAYAPERAFVAAYGPECASNGLDSSMSRSGRAFGPRERHYEVPALHHGLP